MHHRQGQREAAHHTHRRPHGRLAALPAPGEKNHNAEALTDTIEADTIDCGACPVTQPAAPENTTPGKGPENRTPENTTRENTPLDLPPLEETASIQLALISVLIDVLQALDKIKRERPEEANPAIRTARASAFERDAGANHQAMLMPCSSACAKTERRFVIFSTLRTCLPR